MVCFRGLSQPSSSRGRAHPPCTLNCSRNSCFLQYDGLGVDGVPAARRYQAIARSFGLYSYRMCEFWPRRPLPRQSWFDGAKPRLWYRSTANPATLLRLFCRIRALVFAMGPVTRIFVFAVHFTARCGRRGYLPLAVIADVAGAAVMLDACGERESDILPPSLICRHSAV